MPIFLGAMFQQYGGHFSEENKKSACGNVGGRPGLPENLARLEFHRRAHRAWQTYLNAICQMILSLMALSVISEQLGMCRVLFSILCAIPPGKQVKVI